MSNRAKELNSLPQTTGPVIYWLSRDQRAADNWALLYAQEQALTMRQALVVVFCKAKGFLGATGQHYDFMLQGLRELYADLKEHNIPFIVFEGDPVENVSSFAKKIKAGLVVTDFSPLKISRGWKKEAAKKITTRFVEVDAHNIVPCYLASNKQEYGARFFRPKINNMLSQYLSEFPKLLKHPFNPALETFELSSSEERTLKILEKARNYFQIKSGESAAREKLEDFIAQRLVNYSKRNDPNEEACSDLSPYLHFGQISAQRVALEVSKQGAIADDYLEELIIRRELADNFCYYNSNYDNLEGFPAWAKKTLYEHRFDVREYLYSIEQLENAVTHDLLWNAAQMEMVKTGKMHGYLRMYWAKKLLEWTDNVEEALHFAIFLNDKYQLDGRDPNGYTGIAWSLGGVHDRAWGERSIFGKIRYMSYEGCKRKFDVEKYILRITAL